MASPDLFPTLAHCNKKGTIKTQFRDDFNRVFWGPNCIQIAKMEMFAFKWGIFFRRPELTGLQSQALGSLVVIFVWVTIENRPNSQLTAETAYRA